MIDSEYLGIYQRNYDRLSSEINSLYEIYEKRNKDRKLIHDAEIDANNTKAMIDAYSAYRNGVESFFLEKEYYLTEEEATKRHEELEKEAIEKVRFLILILLSNECN